MFLICIKYFDLVHDFLEGRGHFSSEYCYHLQFIIVKYVRHVEVFIKYFRVYNIN